MVTLPFLLGFVGLELAAGVPLALVFADPGRRARRALLVLAGVALLAALALLAWGAARVGPGLALATHPDWLALVPRVVAAFAGAVVLAFCLALIAPTALARLALAFAGLLGLVALVILDAVYSRALVLGVVLSPLLGAVALGHLAAALALAVRTALVGRLVETATFGALGLGVGAIALQGFLLLGHVTLGLPGPSARPLLHGAVSGWFWLRLGAGVAAPLAVGLLAQRVDARRPARLAALLAAMIGLLVLGEMISRLLLAQTGVLF
jgi:hypothetical protein